MSDTEEGQVKETEEGQAKDSDVEILTEENTAINSFSFGLKPRGLVLETAKQLGLSPTENLNLPDQPMNVVSMPRDWVPQLRICT